MWCLAFVAFCIVIGVALAEPVWQVLPNAPTLNRLDDVVFVDERTGWVAGHNGFIHRTTDGGATWQSAEYPGILFRSLAFTSPSRGWAGTLTPSSPLWSTQDGGVTWQPVTNLPDPQPLGICGMRAVSGVVYGVGRYNGPAIVVKSMDGVTWTTMDLTPLGAFGLVDCHFVDADSGFVLGGAGTDINVDPVPFVASTWNGGATWEVRHRGTEQGGWCWKVSFPSRRIGYASIESFAEYSDVLKTTDGGLTWTETPSFTMGRLQGLGFVSEQRGWAGGDQNTFTTTDGGRSWTVDDFGSRLNRIRFLGPSLGFASGSTVYMFAEPSAAAQRTMSEFKGLYRPAR
jgi:photosystem II stability/assembly factor-like uncharacterized protein